jgi:hypothetical protein
MTDPTAVENAGSIAAVGDDTADALADELRLWPPLAHREPTEALSLVGS